MALPPRKSEAYRPYKKSSRSMSAPSARYEAPAAATPNFPTARARTTARPARTSTRGTIHASVLDDILALRLSRKI